MSNKAFAEERKIVKVFDNLKVYGPLTSMSDFDSQNLDLKDQWNMTSFPYIDLYTSNVTSTGVLCYTLSNAEFESDCNSTLTTDWIMVNPFDQTNTNDIMNNVTLEGSTVTGLVFVTSDIITTN